MDHLNNLLADEGKGSDQVVLIAGLETAALLANHSDGLLW
jgi:hypothetical protein